MIIYHPVQVEMATAMLPGETVTRAMKRIGGGGASFASGGGGAGMAAAPSGRALGKREKMRLEQLQKDKAAAAVGGVAVAPNGEGTTAAPDRKLLDRCGRGVRSERKMPGSYETISCKEGYIIILYSSILCHMFLLNGYNCKHCTFML